MAAVSHVPAGLRPLWYRSFYWRIAASFIALVVIVLVGQSLMFSYLLTRPQGAFTPGDPNASATAVAAHVSAALAINPAAAIDILVREAWPGARQGVYLVMKDGREAANLAAPLSPAIRAQVTAALAGQVHTPAADTGPTGPVVTAPVQIAGELRGLVVLPPPPPRGPFSEVGRLLSLPGTIVLFTAAAAVGAVIFVPVRRRLRALEAAAERIGAGDLAARADDAGGDEIAVLAAAFNRMSAELAVRTEALHESDRVRRQMLADVSHELRTPLTALRGYLDTLAMPDVSLDAGVVGNLVANALRHTPAGGTIHLDAAVVDAGYRLEVVDSGGGIPPAHLPHVFDRFYKADSARSGGHGGSGLGLSIVKAIVERHGGTIAVDSRPGRTAFVILLPRAATSGPPADQSRPSANL